MGNKKKVILRKIPDYDSSKIERIIGEGLNELGLTQKAHGRITIKPNVVMAYHSVAPSAFTRPEFLEGMVNALKKGKKEPSKIIIAEKCGPGVPTSRMFRRAGNKSLIKTQVWWYPYESSLLQMLDKSLIFFYHDRIKEKLLSFFSFIPFMPQIKVGSPLQNFIRRFPRMFKL